MTKRVLIVEDNRDIRESLAELLAVEGYLPVQAAGGDEALAILKSITEQPAVILLDLMMPGTDGYQFRAAQLADPAVAAIPVVLMSASNNLDQKARQLGAQGFLRKPFHDPEAVLDALAHFF